MHYRRCRGAFTYHTPTICALYAARQYAADDVIEAQMVDYVIIRYHAIALRRYYAIVAKMLSPWHRVSDVARNWRPHNAGKVVPQRCRRIIDQKRIR